jgi:hypothetical protein
VGQGFARPEYETQPIDVPVNKLLGKGTLVRWHKHDDGGRA